MGVGLSTEANQSTVNLPSDGPLRPITYAEIKDLRETFALYDLDGNGTIDARELRLLANAMGLNVRQEEVSKILKKLDLDSNGTVDFDEFARWWRTVEHGVRKDASVFALRGQLVLALRENRQLRSENQQLLATRPTTSILGDTSSKSYFPDTAAYDKSYDVTGKDFYEEMWLEKMADEVEEESKVTVDTSFRGRNAPVPPPPKWLSNKLKPLQKQANAFEHNNRKPEVSKPVTAPPTMLVANRRNF